MRDERGGPKGPAAKAPESGENRITMRLGRQGAALPLQANVSVKRKIVKKEGKIVRTEGEKGGKSLDGGGKSLEFFRLTNSMPCFILLTWLI
jgi:hypothetical protein